MARRRPARSRRGKRSHGDVLWYFAIVVCLALVVGVGFLAQKLMATAQVDERTLCHTGGALNVTAVLLDLTDPLGATQQARLNTILADEIARSSVDTMIAIGVVSEDPAKWGEQFAKCKPATGEDANGLYENPTIIAERYTREFTDPFRSTLQSMLTAEAENQSPIMEALQSLVSETPDFTRAKGHRKIIIVSDMLQHSDNLSFYRGQGWDYFDQAGGSERLAANLTSVDVDILRIPRSGQNIPSTEMVEDFWSRYFDRQGSRPPSVRSLGDL